MPNELWQILKSEKKEKKHFMKARPIYPEYLGEKRGCVGDSFAMM